MPKLSVGDAAPSIRLPAIDGSTFDMTQMKGKKVILTFFRFSSCPLCNMRIRRITQRWNEFSDDTVMVGVFDAGVAELKKRMKKHDVPFTIVADEIVWKIHVGRCKIPPYPAAGNAERIRTSHDVDFKTFNHPR